MPHKRGAAIIYHANRLIIHPDYQGLQLGLWFSETTNDLFLRKKENVRIMAKFSHPGMMKTLLRSEKWKLLKVIRVMGKLQHTTERKTGYRDGGIKTFHFEYVQR